MILDDEDVVGFHHGPAQVQGRGVHLQRQRTDPTNSSQVRGLATMPFG
jgi:hypothetical protein